MRRSVLPILTLWLAGCPFIGDRAYDDRVRDVDGDGAIADRFGGPDCVDDDPTITNCDADGDGHRAVAVGGPDCDDADAGVNPDAAEVCDGRDNDCDQAIDDADDGLVDAPSWYRDDDRDGFGDPDQVAMACAAPANHVADDRDCDDTRDDIRPGATEFCDDLDRNCDGDPYADAVDPTDHWTDADGDGFGAEGTEPVAFACLGPVGTAPNDADCDDTNDTAFPTATEVWYDGVDQDCLGDNDYDQDADGDPLPAGGGADCDDLDPLVSTLQAEVCNDGVDNDCDLTVDEPDGIGAITYYVDADGDTYGDDGSAAFFCPGTVPPDRVVVGGDCNDANPNVSPVSVEVCDDLDNNCNGAVDDSAIDANQYYQDSDGDGFGSLPIEACELDFGLASNPDDCNDADPFSYPGAPEICGDSFRQDCSMLSPDDCDGDGFDDLASGGADCDDTRDDVNPAALEICDGFDNDCDGLFDSADPSVDLSTQTVWFVDDDGDGFGTNQVSQTLACDPQPGEANNSDDCDDTSFEVFPGALEQCDGLDNDCDGFADDDDPDDTVVGVPQWHLDSDGDGFGDPAIAFSQTCAPPDIGSWVTDATDCNDGVFETNPFAVEVCDGVDNDCDLLVDDADPDADLMTWFRDGDGDGWGVDTDVLAQCSQPMGYIEQAGDCNDFDTATNPGAEEVCDAGADNDCDGLPDDTDPDLTTTVTWYEDGDSDGFGNLSVTMTQCAQPTGFVSNSGDCNDAEATISPAAAEQCDTIDNDCDLLIDDADSAVVNAPLWYADADADGFGDSLVWLAQCIPPAVGVWLPQSGDCDDSDPDRNPAAPEVCDAVDNDCDGAVDALDSNVVATDWYFDGDSDGFGDPGTVLSQCGSPGVDWVVNDDDCNDSSPAFAPGAPETCDGFDNDCDGLVDDADPQVMTGPMDLWYTDADNDGWGDDTTAQPRCDGASDQVAVAGDCNDANAQIHPAMFEFCDGIDNDCDTLFDGADTNVIDTEMFWVDADMDFFGDKDLPPFLACPNEVGPGFTTNEGGDCDDSDDQVHPFAAETCSTPWDDDCDGVANEFDGDTVDLIPLHRDNDMDTFGDPFQVQVFCVVPSSGWVADASDCNDNNNAIAPNASEVCDGADNDCDGGVDDFDPQGPDFPPTWFFDDDGDGVGAPTLTADACVPPPGYVATFDDCDPFDASQHPGAIEVCNGEDDNCDFVIDEPSALDADDWYPDGDMDGYGSGAPMASCNDPGPGWSLLDGDCDPGSPAIHPGAVEVCDGGTTDQDCDGLIDDLDPSVQGIVYFADTDGDGYGDPANVISACVPPAQFTLDAGDCNDTDPGLFPGQSVLVAPLGGDYTTINDALAQVCDDADIAVVAGLYPEALLLDRPVTLRGADPSNPPVIEAPFTQAITVIGTGVVVQSVRLTNPAFVSPLADVQFGEATFRDVTFEGANGTTNGGGLAVLFSDATCDDCRFVGNAADFGGGLYAEGSTVIVTGATFEGNTALFGGGLYAVDSTVVVGTSDFEGNVAFVEGAAFEIVSSQALLSALDVRDHVGVPGGAGLLRETSGELVGSHFEDNADLVVDAASVFSVFDVRDTTVIGGAQVTGAAALELKGPMLSAKVENVTILGSFSNGMRLGSPNPVVRNTTIVGSAGHNLQTEGVVAGDVTNLLLYDYGTAPDWDQVNAFGGFVDFCWFTDAGEAAAYPASSSGDPQLQTHHPNLTPHLWDVHPVGSPVVDGGNPAIQDTDGSVSDIGATGGPGGDASWYLDDDGDGMPDGWETAWFGDDASPTADDDADGEDNLAEFLAGTIPTDPDTDDDGSLDGPSDGDPLDPLVP